MPFSVLRVLFAGALGWIFLGAGIYLLYEWNQERTSPDIMAVQVPVEERQPGEPDQQRTVIVQHDRQRDWLYLSGGLLLLLLGTGGWRGVWQLFQPIRQVEPSLAHAPRYEKLRRPDGSQLQVTHVGPEDGPTILLTHGWGLDQSDWDGVKKALGAEYHLVLWDLPGLGKSKPPRNADYSLEKMASDLEAVLTQSTTGPVILVGHSIGGMIQQVFCRLFPQHLKSRVQGLVFVHTTYTNPTKTAMGSPVLMALQEPVLKPLTYLSIWLAPLAWISNWQSYWNGSLHVSARLTSFAGQQTWSQLDHVCRLQARAWPAVVGRGSVAMTKFDEQATLPQIEVPALVVIGADDRLTKPEAGKYLATQLPQARVVSLEPGGHFGHWEQESKFLPALQEFAKTVLAKETSPGRNRLMNEERYDPHLTDHPVG